MLVMEKLTFPSQVDNVAQDDTEYQTGLGGVLCHCHLVQKAESKLWICGVGSSLPSFVSWISSTSIL